MNTTKARIQGNAVVVTIPKSFGVKPGTEYWFSKESDSTLKLTPTKKVPETMEELFKGWNKKYITPNDLQSWNQKKPGSEEVW